MLVQKGGRIDVLDSEFCANYLTSASAEPCADGICITNAGGHVQCDVAGCLPVCTECADHLPRSPSSAPTVPLYPTVRMGSEKRGLNLRLVATWVIGSWIGCLGTYCVIVVWRRYARKVRMLHHTVCAGATLNVALLPGAERMDEAPPELSPSLRPLLRQGVELVGSSIMNSHALSLAPVFAVEPNESRIVIWSPGMVVAAPMLADPLNLPLSGLPFVNPNDGCLLNRRIRTIFDAPAQHDTAATFMLHLRTSRGFVLLEMRADHLVGSSGPIIVLAGRHVDESLACMMARESSVAASESNLDLNRDADDDHAVSVRFRSVSEVGSDQADDIDEATLIPASCASDSTISELTTPTLSEPSTFGGRSSAISGISSMTMSSVQLTLRPPPSVARRANALSTTDAEDTSPPKYRATQTFEATEPWQLSFAQGDFLQLLNADSGGGWCEVANMNAPGRTGKVPSWIFEPCANNASAASSNGAAAAASAFFVRAASQTARSEEAETGGSAGSAARRVHWLLLMKQLDAVVAKRLDVR